jgi:4-hydroxy-2-oxoheptanedioate aldolase
VSGNPFKWALSEPHARIGLWLGLADAYSAELCATAGFDWLLIDGEHAPNDLRTTLGVLQAVAAYPSHPVVRIPHGDAVLIKQVLELGATTLLVPMVESAAQARELVRAMRYPPAGVRGVGSGLARSSRWGGNSNYLAEANDGVCLLVQVETIDAVAHLDEIVTVDGVDGVFIGPADLAASIGKLGQPGHADVRAVVEDAIVRIRRAGKGAGVLATDEALARRYIELGANFVAVGVDATLLAGAARSLARRFKSPGDAASATGAAY